MRINGVTIRKRDMLAGAIFSVGLYCFLYVSLAMGPEIERIIIEAKK
tara:strand:+ start:885 stop:1025 length:141 start_codon:yes stop_codon:yes gene_type:complete